MERAGQSCGLWRLRVLTMRRTVPPDFAVIDVIQSCVDGLRHDDLADRVGAEIPHFIAAEAAYLKHGGARDYTSYPAHLKAASKVSSAEMKWLYEQRLRSSPKCRSYYNKIINSADFRRCPLCGVGFVRTVDHYLPQQYFPALSITPLNLVPSCRDCNSIKSTHYPANLGEQTLHPYFDDVSDIWLKAEVAIDDPVTLRFFAEGPAIWEKTMQDRVKSHFKVFGLGPLFASNASSELQNLRSILQSTYSDGDRDAVRSYLVGEYNKYSSIHSNGWQAAAYDALARDDKYCDGGFRSA